MSEFTDEMARAHFLERVARYIEGTERALFEVPSVVANCLRIIARGEDAYTKRLRAAAPSPTTEDAPR